MKQITVRIENMPGRLAGVTRLLADNGINLSALSLADTADFGLLRLIADQPEKAQKVLAEKGYLTIANDVLGVMVEDKPGSLASILELLAADGVGVEYAYAFNSPNVGTALMALRADDCAKAAQILEKAGIAAFV